VLGCRRPLRNLSDAPFELDPIRKCVTQERLIETCESAVPKNVSRHLHWRRQRAGWRLGF
jgi:hypothetical protein